MKSEVNQLLRDVNVAIQLGRPEAIDIALRSLLRFPGVAGNEHMDTQFVDQVVLPIGQSLSALPSNLLRPLLSHSLVVGRAIGAVSIAHRFFVAEDVVEDDLRKGAQDPRADVRFVVGQVMIKLLQKDPLKCYHLGKSWLEGPSPKLHQTALEFLPHLEGYFETEFIARLRPLGIENHRDVNRALVDALIQLGSGMHSKSVLTLLMEWCETPEPNQWVICQTLSAPWAVRYPNEVIKILSCLIKKEGESKQVLGAIKALSRHGLDVELNSILIWKDK